MTDRAAKVGVKLTVDDRTAAATARIKRSFESVREKVRGATSALGGFVSQSLAMAGGLSIDRAIRGMASLAASTLREAEMANNAKRGIAGLFSAASGLGYSSVYKAASGVNDQLELMGVRAGVSADSVVDSFRTMYGFVSRTGGGIDDAVGMVGDLTAISGALNIPMQDLSSSAMGISVGMVRARDPLVQMMRTFGGINVMSDSFKKLSESAKMQKMMDALSLIGDKFRGVPPGFTQLKQGVSDLWADVKEAFGVPVVEKLNSSLLRLRNYWIENKAEIESWVTTWGEKAAELVESAASSAVKAFRWVQSHWDDIVSQVKKIPYYLAGGMAARAAGGGLMGIAGNVAMGVAMRGGGARAAAGAATASTAMTPGMMGAFGQALPATLRAAPALGASEIGVASAGTAAAGSAAIPVLAAVAGTMLVVGLAANAFRKNIAGLGDEFTKTTSQLSTSFSALSVSAGPAIDLLSELAGYLVVGLAHGINAVTIAIGGFVDVSMDLLRRIGRGLGLVDEVAPVEGARRPGGTNGMIYRGGRWVPDTPSGVYGPTGEGPVDLDPTVAQLRRQQREREERARRDREREDRALVDANANRQHRGAPTIDARGSTFNIKQDFRNEDPDRIASIFTRDIQRAAEARVTARTSTPFGP